MGLCPRLINSKPRGAQGRGSRYFIESLNERFRLLDLNYVASYMEEKSYGVAGTSQYVDCVGKANVPIGGEACSRPVMKLKAARLLDGAKIGFHAGYVIVPCRTLKMVMTKQTTTENISPATIILSSQPVQISVITLR